MMSPTEAHILACKVYVQTIIISVQHPSRYTQHNPAKKKKKIGREGAKETYRNLLHVTCNLNLRPPTSNLRWRARASALRQLRF